MPSMETIISKSKESPNAGKGGETTAAAGAASSRTSNGHVNLTPVSVASLLSSAFAVPDATRKAAGQEVQPAARADDDETPPAATPPETETPETPETPEVNQTAEGGEQTVEGGEQKAEATGVLPEHLEAELAQWEAAGGTLPASLQKLVERRIGKVVGEREAAATRATAAEAEATRLAGELAAVRSQKAEGGTRMPMDTAEALAAKVAASKKFLKDARPFVGGYANEDQKTRLEALMQQNRIDENGLRQMMDEVSDWLSLEVPQQQQALQQFKQAEAQVAPIMASRFASLAKKDSPEAKVADEILQMFPEIKSRTPAHGLAIGTYVLGKIAAEHLLAASPEGDMVEALKGLLTKYAPIPLTSANGKVRPGALPGKVPLRSPVMGSAPAPARVNGRAVELDQASQELRENPTMENVTRSLKIALR